jgi:hypothetical protein
MRGLGLEFARGAKQGETAMLCGPKGTEQDAFAQCGLCGRVTELTGLPGRSDRYCLDCSADVATSCLLSTEIDAATMAGQDAEELIAEFAQLSTRMLERSQSAQE